MKLGYIFLLLMLLLSCEGRKQTNSVEGFIIHEPNAVSKLEQLMSLSQDPVLDYYDLSNDLLTEFPDLSGYTIKSLNLSHNYLDTLIPSFLPKDLEKLNLSYNAFMTFELIDSITYFKELNFSHNDITRFALSAFIERLDLSYNNLNRIYLLWTYKGHFKPYKNNDERKNIKYLNISHNPNLLNIVDFEPTKIDTIIRHNITNDKKLIWFSKKTFVMPGPCIYIIE